MKEGAKPPTGVTEKSLRTSGAPFDNSAREGHNTT